MPKRSEDTEPESKPKSQDKPAEQGSGGNAYSAAAAIRDALTTIARNTPIPFGNTDFFVLSDFYMKVPVRDECISTQPETPNKLITIGDKWGPDGTVTTPICPLRGTVITNIHDFAHDPTSVWTSGDWYKSWGGWLFKALSNNIRANKYANEAQLIKIVMALVEYADMARHIMMYETFNYLNYTNPMTYILNQILSSSGGSPAYTTPDYFRSQLIKNVQERFFPWPLMTFWSKRGGAYAYQFPWTKYCAIVPFSTMTPKILCRVFDMYITTDNWVHPETYLRDEGLWNMFRDNILPLLWQKQNHENYIGQFYPENLRAIGFKPLHYNRQYLFFLLNHYWTHPFDETLGAGQFKNPIRGFDDDVTTFEEHFWDSDGYGRKFILPADCFCVPNNNVAESILRSPYLDPVEFLWHIINNYASNDDGAIPTWSCSLGGIINSDGTVTDLTWDEYLSVFLDHAMNYNKFESYAPDPDVDVWAALEETERGHTWFDFYKYNRNPDVIPIKMPAKHWYHDTRNLFKFGCSILNVKPQDIEIYKVQSSRVEQSGGVQTL